MRLFEFVPECETDCSVTAWLQTGKDIGLSKNDAYPAVIICPVGEVINKFAHMKGNQLQSRILLQDTISLF